MSKNSEILKDDEKQTEALENYIGFLGVIIALTMTIAWDFVKFTTNESVIFAAILYYFMCVTALGVIVLFYYFKTKGEISKAKFLEGLFFPLAGVPIILLAVIPLLGLGYPAFYALLLWLGLLAFYGVVWLFLARSRKKFFKSLKDSLKEQ